MFTLRESGVIACLLDHMQDKEISRATGISEPMVRKTLRQLFYRFDVYNRRDLARLLQDA